MSEQQASVETAPFALALEPGETVIWWGKPDRASFWRRNMWRHFTFGSVGTAFGISMLMQSDGSTTERAISAVMIVIGIAIFIAPGIRFHSAQKTYYIMTNIRYFILGFESCSGRWIDTGDIEIENTDENTGHVLFIDPSLEERPGPRSGFLGLNNPEAIADLIRSIKAAN
jgi:hypothetical protein